MEKINDRDQYGKNNLTEKPLEYYLEAFEKEVISNARGGGKPPALRI